MKGVTYILEEASGLNQKAFFIALVIPQLKEERTMELL